MASHGVCVNKNTAGQATGYFRMNNVDLEEIKKFDEFAKDWWDPNGSMKPLHLMNPLRLQYIKDHTTIAEKKVLDVGCGGGLLAEAMARESAIVTGIDLSEEAIKVARQHADKKRVLIDYQCTAVETIAQSQQATFDVITCMELLEHVPDPGSILQACADCLKPGGKLFVSTLNRNIKSYLGAILAAEYLLRLLPRGTHQYGKFIRPSELSRWAKEVGLRFGDLQGICFKPLSNKFILCDDVSINYLAYYEK